MIDLRAINKVFRTETVETYALREFTLTVDQGEFVAITGHSGSGKTTLLNVLGLRGRHHFDVDSGIAGGMGAG